MVKVQMEFHKLCIGNLPSELPELLLNMNLYIDIIT